MIDVTAYIVKQLATHPVGCAVLGFGLAAATVDGAVEAVTQTATLVDWGQFIALILAGVGTLLGSIAAIINALANWRHGTKNGRSDKES